MIGGLLYDGGRIVAEATTLTSRPRPRGKPISHAVGILVAGFGPGAALAASNFGWWLHNVVILIFVNLLPLSKHFHIITSLPNVFFSKTQPMGALSKMDLENGTTFGTSYINQFSWKQVLDMYSCTECGRCASHCPATMSGKQLAPRQLLLNLRDYLYEREGEMLALKPAGGTARRRDGRGEHRRRAAHSRRGAVGVYYVPGL